METEPRRRHIVIVGVCGSGKSALADELKARGYDAEPVAQEHSLVPELFLHHSPDFVIYLEASDATVARRKETRWQPSQLKEQRRRLKLARERADIRLDTDDSPLSDLAERVQRALESPL